MTIERVKFTYITRTICPTTKIHFLDAIDTQGIHWSAEMSPHIESWLVWSKQWSADRQQPLDI